MRRLLALFGLLVPLLAFAPAPSGGQDSAGEPTVPAFMVEYRGEPPNDEPWLGILTDDAGNAYVQVAVYHGGIELLTRDGIGYMPLDRDGAGLQEHLLASLIARPAGAEWRAKAALLGDRQLEIESAGTERVAGVEGRVYRLRLTEGALRSPDYEVVISTDPRLAPAGRELLRLYDSLRAPLLTVTGTEPQPYAAFRGLLARGTPIRLGRNYRLRAVGSEDVPARLFVLPTPLLDRASFIALLERERAFGPEREASQPSGNVLLPGEASANEFLPDDADDPQ